MFVKQLTNSELEKYIGGSGLNDIIDAFRFGERVGEKLAHLKGHPTTPPMCYHYEPAYPGRVLPCH